MILEIHLDKNEQGTPFEVANALINYYIARDHFPHRMNILALEEISEHIKVFVSHTGKEQK